MFWTKKKVFNLQAMEQAVHSMRAKGVEPQPASMVAAMAVVEALGVPVTAVDEGQAEVAARREDAREALATVPAVEKKAAAEVRRLEIEISGTKRSAEARMQYLREDAESATRRADYVEGLLKAVTAAK